MANHPEDIWRRVAKRSPDECWEWTGGRGNDGYGKTFYQNKTWRAHRLIYTLVYGVVPADLVVRHSCDTPLCCNPGHLLVGTVQDNVADRVARGRTATGDQSGPRLHPERMARGDQSGPRLHPERMSRGDAHYSRLHPERMARGERNGCAKLTEAAVVAIRHAARSGVSFLELGRRYGVHARVIADIMHGKRWRHVPDE